MAKTIKNRKLIKSEKGSVMMEYLILNLGFFVVLAMAAHFTFPDFTAKPAYKNSEPGNLNFVVDEEVSLNDVCSYGRLGTAFIRHYNMVLDIISMPYP